jgi:plastocyanin
MVLSARRLLALVAVAALGGGAAQAVAAGPHVGKATKKHRRAAAARARAVKVGTGTGWVPPAALAGRPPLTGAGASGAGAGAPGGGGNPPGGAPGAGGGSGGAPGTTTPPTTTLPPSVPAVGVTLDDRGAYSARLSRATVTAGAVVVQLINQGEDDHNLRVVPVDHAGATVDVPLTGPGQNTTRTLTLTAGTYRVFCTLTTPVDHETAGMNATLQVTAAGS